MTAELKAGEYFSFFIIGIRNDPSDATSASARPTMEPMKRHVPIVTRARAPRTCPMKALTKSMRAERRCPFRRNWPVRTKKGTESREKPFIPSNIRCTTRSCGYPPTRRYIVELRIMLNAMGKPMISKKTKHTTSVKRAIEKPPLSVSGSRFLSEAPRERARSKNEEIFANARSIDYR